MKEIKILIIDDDPKIRAMLKRSLTYAGYTVVMAEDGMAGWDSVIKNKPQLIILDIMLPEIDGFEVCHLLRKEEIAIPILMLTAKDEIRDRVKGLDCGADDYLVKPFALEELLARVRALLRRNSREQEVLEFETLKANTKTYQVWQGEREVELTPKEFKILTLFMAHPNQVITREKLMETIWGYDYEAESNVLEVYIGYLRHKLEEEGEERLIHTVRGVGYVLKKK